MSRSWWRRLTIGRTFAGLLMLAVFFAAARTPADTDVWWHLATARQIMAEGFVRVDPFSATKAGEPWINHSWGSQLLLYGLWRLAGHAGLVVWTAGLATAGMALVYGLGRGPAYHRALPMMLGLTTAIAFWSPRPHMTSFLLCAVVWWILLSDQRGERDWLWAVPPLIALWANLHGGFALGWILLLGTLAGRLLDRRRGGVGAPASSLSRLALVTGASFLAPLVNPYGWRILLVPFDTVRLGSLRLYIDEWASPDFHDLRALPFAVLLVSVLLVAALARTRVSGPEALLVAGAGLMALLAARNVAFFAIVATPLLMRSFDRLLTSLRLRVAVSSSVSTAGALLHVCILLVAILAVGFKTVSVADPSRVAAAEAQLLPAGAARHLSQNPPAGGMFNAYNFGGYLLWSLPEVRVFIDGRTDLYGDAFTTRVIEAERGNGWEGLLDEYGVSTAVVETNSHLDAALEADSGWSLGYEDAIATVYERTGS